MRITSALLCDQIRREDNGKLLAIGIYTDTVSASGFPLDIPLAMLMQVELSAGSNQSFTIRLLLDDEGLATLTAEISSMIDQTVWLPVGMPAIRIAHAGLFCAEVQTGDDKWSRFLTLPINELTPPNG